MWRKLVSLGLVIGAVFAFLAGVETFLEKFPFFIGYWHSATVVLGLAALIAFDDE